MSAKFTIEQLRRERTYLDLTPQQQKLVEIFLGTSNKLAAVQAAYNCKSVESARTMSYSLFANPKVVVAWRPLVVSILSVKNST